MRSDGDGKYGRLLAHGYMRGPALCRDQINSKHGCYMPRSSQTNLDCMIPRFRQLSKQEPTSGCPQMLISRFLHWPEKAGRDNGSPALATSYGRATDAGDSMAVNQLTNIDPAGNGIGYSE